MELITANCDNLLMEIRKIFREEIARTGTGIDRPFLTRKDVCEMLSVSPSTLRNWAKIGTLAISFFVVARSSPASLRRNHSVI